MWFTSEALPAGYDGAPVLDEDKIPKVDLGQGIVALLPGSIGDELWQLSWQADGYSYGLTTSAIDRTHAAALGAAFVADRDRDDLPAPAQDLELTEEWNATATMPDLQLDVTYVAPSGNDVGYSLRSIDHLVAMSPQYHEIPGGSLPGQALPLLRDDDKWRISPTRNLDYPTYLGRWPGAVVRAPGWAESDPEGDPVPTQAEYETLLSSLRPVTPAEWRTFARGAPTFDPKVVQFESVQDLAAG